MFIALAVIVAVASGLVALVLRDLKRNPNRDWLGDDDQWSDIEGW